MASIDKTSPTLTDPNSEAVSLPADVLAHVLRYMSPEQRFGPCALVCRAWYTAAVAGISSSLGMRLWNLRVRGKSAELWLQKHGSNLSSLTTIMGYSAYPDEEGITFKLPSLQLQQLQQLSMVNLPLPEVETEALDSNDISSEDVISCLYKDDSSNCLTELLRVAHSPLADLTNLTSLYLEGCVVSWGRLANYCHLGHLSALSNLKQLQLVYNYPHGFAAQEGFSAAFGRSLARMTQLTQLELKADWATDEAIERINRLSQLQELKLEGTHIDCHASGLWSLPTSLTQLELAGVYSYWLGGLHAKPWLGRLTELKQLTVRAITNTVFCPSVLSNMLRLEQLSLDRCELRGDGGGADGVEDLLTVLPSLPQLQQLDLTNTDMKSAAPEAFSALLSCSNLTQLDLRDSDLPAEAFSLALTALSGNKAAAPTSATVSDMMQSLLLTQPLPDLKAATATDSTQMSPASTTVPHMMQSSYLTRSLPNLKVLRLGRHQGHHWYIYLGPGHVELLVSCCPSLRELWLAGAVAQQVSLTALQQLTRLTMLSVGGDWLVYDTFAAEELAPLTGLRHLEISQAAYFTFAGLYELTSLTRLTQLRLSEWSSTGVTFVDRDYLPQPAWHCNPGPVWENVRKFCMRKLDT